MNYLTFVTSSGINVFTGERYPDTSAVYRSIHEIYNLVLMGLTVEDRTSDSYNRVFTKELLELNYSDILFPPKKEVEVKEEVVPEEKSTHVVQPVTETVTEEVEELVIPEDENMFIEDKPKKKK